MGRGAEEQGRKGEGEKQQWSPCHPVTLSPGLRRWLGDRAGDIVWNTLIIVTVLLPLAGLTLDVPRYFALRSRLQIAADAAAEAAARQVDLAHYRESGETRLNAATYAGEAHWAFDAAVANLAEQNTATLDSISVAEAAAEVSVAASGTIRLFYNLTPPVTLHVAATSRYRMYYR